MNVRCRLKSPDPAPLPEDVGERERPEGDELRPEAGSRRKRSLERFSPLARNQRVHQRHIAPFEQTGQELPIDVPDARPSEIHSVEVDDQRSSPLSQIASHASLRIRMVTGPLNRAPSDPRGPSRETSGLLGRA